MAEQSEAACLLETGAQYPRRLGLRSASGALIFAGFKRGAFSLYFDDEPIFHFDLEGRWQRAFLDGVHDLKALDGTVQAIERPREGANMVLRRRTLRFAEAADLDATIRQAALNLIDDLRSDRLQPVEPTSAKARPIALEELVEVLERIGRWDAAAWFAHRERFVVTYGPWPLLPPDRPNPVVLQATLGHVGGREFGDVPADEPAERSEEEFAAHVRTVAELLGRRVLQSRWIVMGGSGLMHLPLKQVAMYLRRTAEVFPIGAEPERSRGRLDGIDAFLDNFSPPLPDLDGWRRLRSLHLRRLTLAVESGAPEVRALYGKAWPDDAFRGTIADLKGAGIDVAIVALVGAGGREHAERHVTATADLIGSLNLGRGDAIYLLDADEVGGEPARDRLRGLNIAPLADRERLDQQTWLKDALAPVRSRSGVKVAPFLLEKQGS